MNNEIKNLRGAIGSINKTGTGKNGAPFVTASMAFKGKDGAPDAWHNVIAFGKTATAILAAGTGAIVVIVKGSMKESAPFTRANGEVATAMDITINYGYVLQPKVTAAA